MVKGLIFVFKKPEYDLKDYYGAAVCEDTNRNAPSCWGCEKSQKSMILKL